jgi:Flp pilus assembly protein TadD
MASPPGVVDVSQFETAARLLNEGRAADARRVMQGVVATRPRSAEARWLLGLALRQLGDAGGSGGRGWRLIPGMT